MNHVRSLIADDIPALAELHTSVCSENSDLSTAQRQNYLRQVYLIEAVRAGDAFLTRLDGEWWMPFQRHARVRA